MTPEQAKGVLELIRPAGLSFREVLAELAAHFGDSSADLKRQLEAALADAAEANSLNSVTAELDRVRAEDLAAAATQFRAITSDFPGLTGPLVDLFEGVE